mmetsp:Transcript_22170/g.66557  ORF Transcript_22170/g.66557 Transcript_22170/m.66557 type:complete len:686 (+) Transcript_22170:35-2092(+)
MGTRRSLLHTRGLDVEGELVLLVAAQVRVADEVERQLGLAHLRRRHQVQPHRGRRGQRHALDREQRVGRHVRDDEPPALLLGAREARRAHAAHLLHVLVHLALELDLDRHRLAGLDRVRVQHLVAQLDVGEVVAELRHVRRARRVQGEHRVAHVVLQLEDVEDRLEPRALLLGARQRVRVHVGDLEQRRVVVPEALDDHLGELHGVQRRREPARRRHDVHERLQQRHGRGHGRVAVLAELRVPQGHAPEVRLQEQVGLGRRLVHRGLLRQLLARVRRQLLEHGRLVGPRLQLRELRGVREHLEQRRHARRRRRRRREELHGGVAHAVVGRDHAQVQGLHGHLVVPDARAARLLEVADDRLDEFRQVVAHVAVRRALEVVVVGVLRQAPVVEGPREVVDAVLLGLDRLGDDLGVHVVVQRVVQAGLDGQGLVEHALEVLALGRVAEDAALGVVVDAARAARAADHLEQVRGGVLHVAVLAAVVRLRAQDADHLGVKVQVPAGLGRHHEDPELVLLVEPGDDLGVPLAQALVQEGHARRQRPRQRRVVQGLELRLREGVHAARPEPLRVRLVRGRAHGEVDGRQLALLPRRREGQDGRVRRVPPRRVEQGLAHGEQARGEVRRVEGRHRQLQRHGPHGGVEGEEGVRGHAEPVADVPGVRRGRAQADDPRRLVQLRRDVAEAGHGDF